MDLKLYFFLLHMEMLVGVNRKALMLYCYWHMFWWICDAGGVPLLLRFVYHKITIDIRRVRGYIMICNLYNCTIKFIESYSVAPRLFNCFYYIFYSFLQRSTSSNCLNTQYVCVCVCTKCSRNVHFTTHPMLKANIVILLQLSCFSRNVLGSLCGRRRRHRRNKNKNNGKVRFQLATKFNLAHLIIFLFNHK